MSATRRSIKVSAPDTNGVVSGNSNDLQVTAVLSLVFTEDVEAILQSAGIQPVRLPARSLNLNAYAERFVCTIKENCLDRMIVRKQRLGGMLNYYYCRAA